MLGLQAAEGADLRIVASFSSADVSGHLVARPGITNADGLRGKRLGVRVVGAGLWISTNASTSFAAVEKKMSRRVIGCGAMFTTVRAGWSVAALCGDETIIAAATRLVDAERMAIRREVELGEVYRRDMPPCVRVPTVNPEGLVVAPRGVEPR